MNFYGITPVKRQGKNASGYEGFRFGVLVEPLAVDGKWDFMSFLLYKQ
jgi:hypothetical protein